MDEIHSLPVIRTKRDLTLVDVDKVRKALEAATSAREILELDTKLDAIEGYMRDTGLYDTEEIRPLNETRMLARWKLGRALKLEDRSSGPGRGKKMLSELTSFRAFIKELGLTPPVALHAQRIGAMPEEELRGAFEAQRKKGELCSFTLLIIRARPYWAKEVRKTRHKKIAQKAAANKTTDKLGPFPLIYADPPWRFETYSEKGLEKTPDQHYETMSDEEIESFEVCGVPMPKMSTKDAALLLWCTSSNIHRALGIMESWGFVYKTHAVWDKVLMSQGLVFRNQHECLLYGTKGKMPGPQFQPASVFRFKRGRHSAKPPEIRKAIEKMYPDFDEKMRLEVFARGEKIKGWTLYGFEAEN